MDRINIRSKGGNIVYDSFVNRLDISTQFQQGGEPIRTMYKHFTCHTYLNTRESPWVYLQS